MRYFQTEIKIPPELQSSFGMFGIGAGPGIKPVFEAKEEPKLSTVSFNDDLSYENEMSMEQIQVML